MNQAVVDPIERLNEKARFENWPSRIDSRLEFRNASLILMREVWFTLSSASRLPARRDLSVQILKPFLPNLSILSIVAHKGESRRFRHSYVGTEIAHHFGEITGLCFEDFLPAELLPRSLAFIEAVAEARRPLRIVTQFRFAPVNYLYAEIFAAPLADDGITPDRLMSVSYFSTVNDPRMAAEFAKP
jgi:hypothetical protein